MVDFNKLIQRGKYFRLRYELDRMEETGVTETWPLAIEYNEIGWFILDDPVNTK